MMNQLKEYAADPYSQTSIQFAQNFSQIEIDFDKVGKTADDQHETQMEQWHEDNIVTPNTNLTTENVDAAQICQSARQKMKDNFDVSIVI